MILILEILICIYWLRFTCISAEGLWIGSNTEQGVEAENTASERHLIAQADRASGHQTGGEDHTEPGHAVGDLGGSRGRGKRTKLRRLRCLTSWDVVWNPLANDISYACCLKELMTTCKINLFSIFFRIPSILLYVQFMNVKYWFYINQKWTAISLNLHDPEK